MKHKERKVINHIKNYMRQQTQRLETYQNAISKELLPSKYLFTLVDITYGNIQLLYALLKFYEKHPEKIEEK